MASADPDLIEAFDRQASSCRALGASFTGDLVETLAGELRRGGPLAALLPSWPRDASADAVPLRLCGALRALALRAESRLSSLYPPRAATFDRLAFVRELDVALAADPGYFAAKLQHPPQTNEIGRSAVLLGGFSAIARDTNRPLALLEVGASAGLNLRWDRYRYELGALSWGDPAAPVRIVSEWRGAAPTLVPSIAVASRSGCDAAPIDPRAPDDRLRLRSFVWPEQTERVARLDAALEMASRDDIAVDRADAAPWLTQRLAEPRPGLATVVYHSIVWQYLADATKHAARSAIEAAGRRATVDAPVAWLAFEFESVGQPPALTLTRWPGGSRHRLATAHPHGTSVDWCGPE